MDAVIKGFVQGFAQLDDVAQGLIVYVGSLVVATQVNRAVYTLAWHRRPISPWSLPAEEAPPRRGTDRVPVWGWFGLRRESSLHGQGFWIRPMLVELLFPLCLVYFYFWELNGGLFVQGVFDPVTVHCQFLGHAVLWTLILAATLIDLDEKTIPDEITVPGTVICLIMVAFLPEMVLPANADWLHLATPQPWPVSLDSFAGMVAGLVALWFWCAALLTPRRLWTRSGWRRAGQFLLAKIARDPYWKWIAGAGAIGTAATIYAFCQGGLTWRSFLSTLAGLLFGTLLVWSVRIVASRALQKEALGFGDVTLMAMMGAFLGWQPTIMIFFIAPFMAIAIAVLNLFWTGAREIPYGPYLSLAAVVVVLGWPVWWGRWGLLFVLGWWIPAILLVCLCLMWLMLLVWRRVQDRWGGWGP